MMWELPGGKTGAQQWHGKEFGTLRAAYESIFYTLQCSTSVLPYCYFHILDILVNAEEILHEILFLTSTKL